MMNKFYCYVGRNFALLFSILWAALAIGQFAVWTPTSRIEAVYSMQLFLTWMWVHDLQKENREILERIRTRA